MDMVSRSRKLTQDIGKRRFSDPDIGPQTPGMRRISESPQNPTPTDYPHIYRLERKDELKLIFT